MVRRAFEEETKVLGIGLQLANQRKKQGLTQAELAKKIGTSTPQLSRRNVGRRMSICAPSSATPRPWA
jgi:ribosome-binding protein aMBF1 (putative translation factor)